MTTHSADFPALPTLTDPVGYAMVAAATALAIAVGAPHENLQLNLARSEYTRRRQLQTLALATEAKVLAARTRLHALETAFAVVAYPQNPEPGQIAGSFCPVTDFLYERLVAIHRNAAFLSYEVAVDQATMAMGQNVYGHDDSIQHVIDRGCQQYNTEQQAKHRTLAYASASTEDRPDFPLVPFVKVSSTPVGNGIIRRTARRPVLPVVAIGDAIPSPPFPATRDAINRMTKQEINDLSIVMDDAFRIEPADPMGMWHQKLRVFLTNYP